MFFPPEPSLYNFTRYDKDGNPLNDEDDDDQLDQRESSTNTKIKKRNKKPTKKDYDLCSTNKDDESEDPDHINMSKDSTNSMDLDVPNVNGPTGKKPSNKSLSPSNNNNNSTANELSDYTQYYDEEGNEPNLVERSAFLRKRGIIRNKRDARDALRGVTYKFVPDSRLMAPPPFSGTVDAIKIGPCPKTKTYVAALVYRLRQERQEDSTKTLIYSHGNATDIGAMNFMQAVLAKGLQANVIMYDYSGYGASGGEPLEDNTYRDIKMVYDFTLNHMVQDKDESKIVLYGQSVGSGPSTYLCAKRPKVGGLILHSPFMSGMRVLTPSRLLGCLDVFPNIDRIKNVQCPVMIIHGELDEEVPISHGKALHNAVRESCQRPPWWVPGRGHNDLTDGRSNLIEYINRVSRFMESLD